MKPEPAQPKYQRVADLLAAEVRSGKWDGTRMPSVRGIAKQYEISIVTASRAVQVLRDHGLIQLVERSGAFRLPAASAERWAVVFRLTPGPLRGAVEAMSRSGFDALARRLPMHVHYDAFSLQPGLSVDDATTAAKAAIKSGIGGVFLMPSRASDAEACVDGTFLMGCQRAGLPVVLIERNLRGAAAVRDFDLVSMDDAGTALDATRHLMAIGRRRIAMVVASPTSTHNERVAGYLLALHSERVHAKKPKPRTEHVIWLPDERPSEQVISGLADGIVKDKLDGVICYHDYIAYGLIVELMRRGLRVPQDVAVSGYDNIDTGPLFGIGLTSIENPVEAMAEQAVRLMRQRIAEPTCRPVRIVVPSRLIIRHSTDANSRDTV